MQVFRDAVAIVDPSDFSKTKFIGRSNNFTLFGKRDGLFIGSIDLVLADIWAVEVFIKAPIKDSSGREIGKIKSYHWPVTQVSLLFDSNPVVEITPSPIPAGVILPPIPNIDTMTLANFALGSIVEIAGKGTTGIVISAAVVSKTFKGNLNHDINVFLVDFGSQSVDTELYGSQVILAGDGKLVGMLVQVEEDGGKNIGYIYPAKRI